MVLHPILLLLGKFFELIYQYKRIKKVETFSVFYHKYQHTYKTLRAPKIKVWGCENCQKCTIKYVLSKSFYKKYTKRYCIFIKDVLLYEPARDYFFATKCKRFQKNKENEKGNKIKFFRRSFLLWKRDYYHLVL